MLSPGFLNFRSILSQLGEYGFRPGNYDVLENNCGDFASALFAQLVSSGLYSGTDTFPGYILSTPHLFLQTFPMLAARVYGRGRVKSEKRDTIILHTPWRETEKTFVL